MRSVPPYTVGKILKRLPATHVRGIGQVVVAHSRLYWVTRQLVADLLRVDQGACRLAVKPVKTSDMFLIAKDLLEMWGPTIKIAVPLGNLHKKIKKCDDERNALAHGVWRHYGKGDIRLLRVKGASPPPWEDLKWLFLPKSDKLQPDHFKVWVAKTEDALAQVEEIRKKVKRALKAWPRIDPENPPGGNRGQARKG